MNILTRVSLVLVFQDSSRIASCGLTTQIITLGFWIREKILCSKIYSSLLCHVSSVALLGFRFNSVEAIVTQHHTVPWSPIPTIVSHCLLLCTPTNTEPSRPVIVSLPYSLWLFTKILHSSTVQSFEAPWGKAVYPDFSPLLKAPLFNSLLT
jgi:hypothetical protein